MKINTSPIRCLMVLATFAAGITFVPSLCAAQSLALDNTTTGDPSSSTFSFRSDEFEASEGTWVQSALRFTTGSSVALLNTATIPLVSADASPSELLIEIWDSSGAGGYWGTKLYTATVGASLNDAGLGGWNNYEFTFTDSELDADTQYWIVYRNTVTPELFSHQQVMWMTDTGGIPLAADAYDSFDSELGWTVDGAFSSTADSPSTEADNFKPTVWTVTATAVPEPSSLVLLSLAGLLVTGRRRVAR